MKPARFCSECGDPFPGDTDPRKKTCSDSCRSKRSRRLRRLKREAAKANALPPELSELSDRTQHKMMDVGHKILEEEMRPVVREALNDEVIFALQSMVGLSPAAIKVLEEDLTHENPKIRQKAAELVLRYSVGNPAVQPPSEDDPSRPIQINFALPRPDRPAPAIDAAAEELPAEPTTDTRECDMCHEFKPHTEFVEASERCRSCFDDQQKMAEKILGE